MELKVWVEGIQRIVCGVTVNTTCQDVVFALAHATGKVGRFTLIERWRNNERLLAPHENPLKLLLKWGEYANDVQFILQRSENKQQQQQQHHQQQQQQEQRNEVTGVSHNSNNLNGNAISNRNTQANAVMPLKPLRISNTSGSNSNSNSNNNSNNSSRNSSNINSSNNSSSNDSTLNVQSQSQIQQQQHQQQQNKQSTQQTSIDYNFNTHHYEKSKELRKSFGAHDNVGIVKGIPQRNATNKHMKSPPSDSMPQPMQTSPTPMEQITHFVPRHEKSHSNPIEMSNTQKSNNNRMLDNFSFNNNNNNNINNNNSNNNNINNNNSNNNNNIYHQLGAQNSKSINEINLAEVRNALDRRVTGAFQADSMEIMFTNLNNNNNNNNNSNYNNNNNNNIQHNGEQLIDIYNGNLKYNNNSSPDPYKNTPTISANGALVPPPYRNPPPPRNSPLQQQFAQQMQSTNQQSQRSTNPFLNDCINAGTNDENLEYHNYGNNSNTAMTVGEESASIFQASQYSDLLKLIRYQREKLSAQQMELSKYDAEIGFLESKERDQAQELEAIAREISKADQVFRQGNEQSLQYVEEENELVKQQEKTLKSEIALLRSKLANCETELLQCKNKMRLLMDDIEMEQRDLSNKQKNNRQNVERDFLIEMERIQSEIDQAIHNADTSNKTADNLKKEIHMIENAIADKKRQLEQLINEMKEVNLQSLTVTTSEEIRHLLEGSNKPGSSRRIIGSPRQLENAVPTSKNPHGVWV